jgi:hypothetical protein
MEPIQLIPASNLYVWTLKNNIVSASTPADTTFKTPGFDIEVVSVRGAFYNTNGAILPTSTTRDKIMLQIVAGDTSAQLASTAADVFAFLSMWYDSNQNVPQITLASNTNYQVVFSVDTSTAVFGATYPIRCELQFIGKKKQ